MKKYIFSHEFICALYATLFSILAPLTHSSEDGISTVILASAFAFCLGMTLFLKNDRRVSFVFFVKYTLVLGSFLLFDYIFRASEDTAKYMYSFVIYGVFTVFFTSYVADYEKFTKCYLALALVAGLMMALDPFQGYQWSNTYMEYGLNTMLPAFLASVILSFCYKQKLSLLPMAVIFLLIAVCANKGSLLTALVLLLVGFSYINNNNVLNKKVLWYLALAGIAVYISFLSIYEMLFRFADKIGFDSYALITLSQVLDGSTSNHVYDTRTSIWTDALRYFNQSQIIGNGVGYYSSRSDGYEHNLFLEILNAWGIIGMLFLLIMLRKAYSCYKQITDARFKSLMCGLFIISFVPLLSSLSFWASQSFWLFWGLCLSKKKK